MDHSGELVLTDGSRIGHRSLVKVYRQKVRPTESRESVLIAKMMSMLYHCSTSVTYNLPCASVRLSIIIALPS
jgi:hypothetical protein